MKKNKGLTPAPIVLSCSIKLKLVRCGLPPHQLLSEPPVFRKLVRGFTLVELLIASAIFSVVIVTIYSAFRSGFVSYRNIEEATNIHQSARLILKQINSDLRNSFSYKNNDTGFLGEKEKLNFYTLSDNYREDEIIEDYASVSYELETDKLMRISRRNWDSQDSASKTSAEEMAFGIEKINFSYGFLDEDGKTLKFQEFWNDKTKFPQVVKVELSIGNKVKYDFSRTIYLP